MLKDNYSEEKLKLAIENEIIIAQHKKRHFAQMVSVDLLSSVLSLLKQKDEEIAKLQTPIAKLLPDTMSLDTLRLDAVRLLRTECIGDSEFMELAKHMGADALAKEIPLKVAKRLNSEALIPVYNANCPSCNALQGHLKLNSNDPDVSYCHKCGQALDWSDAK